MICEKGGQIQRISKIKLGHVMIPSCLYYEYSEVHHDVFSLVILRPPSATKGWPYFSIWITKLGSLHTNERRLNA